MLNDFRYGARMLRKDPGFTGFALLALAVGIGANATVFSVVNQALLKPPAYRDPNRLVLLQSMNARQEALEGYSSFDDYQDIRRESKNFETVGAVSPRWYFTLRGTGQAQEVHGQWISAGLLRLLGVNPILGRTFTEAEDRAGAVQVAVLSYELWQRSFGAAPSVIDSSVRIDGSSVRVIGVMPAGFRLLEDAELWVPLGPNPVNSLGRTTRYLTLVGRLAADATLQQASAESAGIMQELSGKYANSNTGFSVKLTSLRLYLTTDSKPILLMLAAAVGFVLLIACANVANLMLTRTLARQQEMAVRIALGAGRLRLTRQLLSESLLLSGIGGALGLLIASWGIFSIRLTSIKGVPSLTSVRIDPEVIAFTALATFLSALIVGVIPALRLSEAGLGGGLRGESRSTTTSASGQRLRAALMISEIALTTVLLAGSGLLLRSLIRLLDVPPGFNTRNVLTFQTNFPGNPPPPERLAFYNRFAADIGSLPGVQTVGAVSRLPLGEGNITTLLTVEGTPTPEGNLPGIDYRIASDSYFLTMGIPLITGRVADPRNVDEVNINQTAARRFWPDQNPIGKRVKFGSNVAQSSWKTVTGVVGDLHHLGLEIAPRPEVYRPYLANPLGAPVFVVRADGNPDTLAAAIRERLRLIDPEMAMFNVSSMEGLLGRSLQSRRFSVLLLTIFAGVALLLAGIGLYGVVSYAVRLRTHEIGIRMAMGAQRSTVVRMVLAQGMRIVAGGIAIGLFVALGIGPLFANLVYGIGARDPIALAASAGVLLLVALAACYIPARRAAELDPMDALRT